MNSSAKGSLSAKAINWLASGQRGISSNTIFTYLTGVDAMQGFSFSPPLDPDDLTRCELLLRQVPELRAEFSHMAELGSVWASLVHSWAGLVRQLDLEVPGWDTDAWGRAPLTYSWMRSIHEGKYPRVEMLA